jgi:hypothetical protein
MTQVIRIDVTGDDPPGDGGTGCQHPKKFVSSTWHGKTLLHNRESRVNQREGYSVFGHRERIVPGGTTAGGSSITNDAIGHSPAGRNPASRSGGWSRPAVGSGGWNPAEPAANEGPAPGAA